MEAEICCATGVTLGDIVGVKRGVGEGVTSGVMIGVNPLLGDAAITPRGVAIEEVVGTGVKTELVPGLIGVNA